MLSLMTNNYRKAKMYWGMVVHTYNPSCSGGRDQEDHCSQLVGTKKISETPISTNKKLGVVQCTCHPSYAGAQIGGSQSRSAWA
jgi:hypothetical protein